MTSRTIVTRSMTKNQSLNVPELQPKVDKNNDTPVSNRDFNRDFIVTVKRLLDNNKNTKTVIIRRNTVLELYRYLNQHITTLISRDPTKWMGLIVTAFIKANRFQDMLQISSGAVDIACCIEFRKFTTMVRPYLIQQFNIKQPSSAYLRLQHENIDDFGNARAMLGIAKPNNDGR